MFKFKDLWMFTLWSFSLYVMIREKWNGTALQWSAFIVISAAIILTGFNGWLDKREG